jgi:integrase
LKSGDVVKHCLDSREPSLASGVNPKIVSERLRRASVGFTLTVYTHVLPRLQKEAAWLAALVDG